VSLVAGGVSDRPVRDDFALEVQCLVGGGSSWAVMLHEHNRELGVARSDHLRFLSECIGDCGQETLANELPCCGHVVVRREA